MSNELINDDSNPQLNRLLTIMSRLRDPQQGCPWDLKQDFRSLIPYTIEESYEVAEAIENGDMEEIKGELGDLLFQVVFYAQLGKEQNSFDFEQVAKAISDKMVHRHPHVFADHQYASQEEFEKDWQKRKELEKQKQSAELESTNKKQSLMDGISLNLPAMTRAVKIQKRAAQVGFDWENADQVMVKVQEELGELQEALQAAESRPDDLLAQAHIEEELGDLICSCINLSRHLKLDPESVLRKNNQKFMQRFQQLEQEFGFDRDAMSAVSLDELDGVWKKIKEQNR